MGGHKAIHELVVEVGFHVLRLEETCGQDREKGCLDLLKVGAELSGLLKLGEIGHGADGFQTGHEQDLGVGEKGVGIKNVGAAERIENRAGLPPQAGQFGRTPRAHGIEADVFEVIPLGVELLLVVQPLGRRFPRVGIARRLFAGEPLGRGVDAHQLIGRKRGRHHCRHDRIGRRGNRNGCGHGGRIIGSSGKNRQR